MLTASVCVRLWDLSCQVCLHSCVDSASKVTTCGGIEICMLLLLHVLLFLCMPPCMHNVWLYRASLVYIMANLFVGHTLPEML